MENLSKKEQFEILSKELLGKLNDVNAMSCLEFPFGFEISEEIEEKYFTKGSSLRLSTIRSMIIIDNSFKKFKIFPTHDIMKTYIQTQKELLLDWQKEIEEMFVKIYGDDEDFSEDTFMEFKNTINEIISGVNKLSMNAIREIASTEEAKSLDAEYSNVSLGGFADFIHNSILNLFK